MSIFKEAAKLKFRFKTSKGLVSTEDLYDIPLKSNDKFNLNEIAKEIYKNIKSDEGIDFIGEVIETDRVEEMKLQIIKEIIKDKKEEINLNTEMAIKKSFNAELDKLIQEKEKESLKNLSVEELKAMRQ